MDDLARMHLFVAVQVLPNTVPTAFWAVFEIFSRPEVVERLRTEVHQKAISIDPNTGKKELDISALGTDCCLLLACLQEAQRLHSNTSTIRKVLEDTQLDGYVLKKGD